MINETNLKKAEAGDVPTLALFDAHGLLLGVGETAPRFAERVRLLTRNVGSFRQDVEREREVTFLGTRLARRDAIPDRVFRDVQHTTERLYRFAIDWVPGFYTNYRMGLLFAGCAYYSFDDFFAVFIVRKAFQKREKWLIYSRHELMAHELCHVAHMGLDSRRFEEMFAYQTATSRFRRVIGGLFRTPLDTYLMLGSVLLLLAAQIANVCLRPPSLWQTAPMPQLFALVAVVFAVISARYLWALRQFNGARRRLASIFGADAAMPVLFRCADDEIAALASLGGRAEVEAWITQASRTDLRWQVIRERFGPVARQD